VHSSPAIAADGTIYFGSDDGYFYAVNADGTLRWRLRTIENGAVHSHPAIAVDGTVYFGSRDPGCYFYAVHGSAPLASTSWPKFHHDNCNTGRAGGP
jgi:outer membrane protein assembly factor BamB